MKEENSKIYNETFEFTLNTDDSSVSIDELAIFLRNIDKLVLSINGTLCAKWNIGYDDIEISVIALEKGSFKIPLLFKKILNSSLFGSTASAIIGGLVVNSLTNSPQPVTIICNDGGTVHVYNNDIIENPTTQESINVLANTIIKNPKIESLSLKYQKDENNSEAVDVSKTTLANTIRDIPNNETNTTLYKQELEIISPVFIAEPRNWKVLLNGKSISVYLKDLDFLDTMKAQNIAFGFGDKIIADIDIQTNVSEKGVKSKYSIPKVISYPKYTKINKLSQPQLFNDSE